MKLNRLIFFLLLFSACNDQDPEKIPAEIISRDTMISILADLHIAEARIINAGPVFRDKTLKSAYLQQVLTRAAIDSSRFLKSFEFYSDHPEIFSGMYEQVIVEISKRQAERAK
jgi:hypothetical protein